MGSIAKLINVQSDEVCEEYEAVSEDYSSIVRSITIEYDMTGRSLETIPLPIFSNPLKEFMGDNFDKLSEEQKNMALELDTRVRYDWGDE